MPGWLTDGIGGLIEKGLDAAMRWALKSLLSALQVVLDGISEWWLGITGPGMAEGSPAMAVQQNTIYFVAVAGMIGTAIGIIRVVRTQSKDASVDLVGLGWPKGPRRWQSSRIRSTLWPLLE